MDDEQQNEDDNQDEKEAFVDDDLQAYLKEMEILESDFSDLDDLDLEELQEMQEAITKVKEQEELSGGEFIIDTEENAGIEMEQREDLDYRERKEAMVRDFSDIDEIDFDELREMKQAIESVKQVELKSSAGEEGEIKPSQEISQELEDRIKQELLKRKEEEKEEIITPEKFLDYIKNKLDKIWYHALYFLVFEVEDHIASKSLLYDVLKEVTSKSAIDPIPEHQFYFGLGYILRLTLNNKKIIRYKSGGKFRININIDMLKDILEVAGKPISTKPVIEEGVKKKMFKNFLEDDFLDI